MTSVTNVGRNPGCWVVACEASERSWFRSVTVERQYFRPDGLRLWEDAESGWFVHPGSELHAKLDAAVKAYEPIAEAS